MDINSHEQLFVITMEECGELVQECSKVLRHGLNDKTHSKLIDEIGDVCAMIQLSLIHISEPTRLLSIAVGGVWV